MVQKISVVVPTKNRCSALNDMLDSLIDQKTVPDEVIIVDQSDGFDSQRMIEEFKRNIDLNKISLIYVYNKKISGAAQARNFAMEHCTGDIIFFFDDDVVLEGDYIQETLKAYNECPEAVGIGGVITNMEYMRLTKISLFNNIFHLGIYHDVREKAYLNYKKMHKPLKTNKISGGCASYKRKVLGDKPFDEKFDHICGGYSFGEDIELSMRLSKKHKLIITPFARLAHYSKTVFTHRKRNEDLFYLEVLSKTYIFFKLYHNDVSKWLIYFWICCGWTLRAMINLVRANTKIFMSLIRGVRYGYFMQF